MTNSTSLDFTQWSPPPKSSILTQEVIVISPREVLVDGIACGKICDAIANMPQLASKIQDALERCWGDQESLADRESSAMVQQVNRTH